MRLLPKGTLMKAPLPPQDMMTPGVKWYLKELDREPFIDEAIPIVATVYTKAGQMWCVLGKNWLDLRDELRVEILAHEAGHVAGGHDVRLQDRDPRLWNIVCDAAIHYSGGVQAWAVEEVGGITYERLELPPAPPEIAYDMLKSKLPPQGSGEGCGREHGGGMCELGGMSEEAKARALVAAIRGASVAGGFSGSQGGGIVREIPDVIPPVPAWVQEVLHRLKRAVNYDDRSRRWIKETRRDVDPIMLPGRSARLGVACTFIWDLSGSISHEDVTIFLAAVDGTPELQGSEVVAFSDIAVGPRPVRYARELAAECPSGGTQFHVGAALRRTGVPVVWITDGYTGDGWPEPHDSEELWVITTEVEPPHGIKIKVN
jgi:Putative metallopeptidase domain